MSTLSRLEQIEEEIAKQNELLQRVNLLSSTSVIGEVIGSLFRNQQQIIVEMLLIRKTLVQHGEQIEELRKVQIEDMRRLYGSK